MSEINKTAKYAVIYLVGVLLERGVSFVMLPIYTRFLTPGDYGTLELLTMTLDVIAILAGLGLSEAVYRFYYRFDTVEERNRVISTVTILLITSYLLASALGLLCSSQISSIVLKGVENGLLYTRIIFLCLFLQSFIIVPLIFVKAQQKPLLFISITSVKLFLQLSLNIYFVVILRMHVLGVLYSTVISSSIIGSFLVGYTFKAVGFKFSGVLTKALIRFGSPLIISSIASFILTFSDRYFLKAYSDVSEVGIYSLGYKLGFVLWMFAVRPIFNIWDPQRFEIANAPDALEINRRMFTLFNIVLVSLGLVISIFSSNLFHIMSAKSFWGAYKIVPLIILAYIIQGWTVFTNFGALFKGKTGIIANGNIIAAGSIIIFSFILIPKYGSFGAAIATILAFLVRFVIIYYNSQKCYELLLDWPKTFSIVFVASLVYVTSILVDSTDFTFSLLKNMTLMIVYIGIILLLPVLESREKHKVLLILRHPLSSVKDLFSNS